jgi:SAM-dependent methyltransferase
VNTYHLTGDRYAFSNSSTRAADQLATLEQHLDPVTTGVLADTPLPADGRCLDIGAGGGSITRWMAERMCPRGHVLAVDIDTGRLQGSDTIEVRQHDIRRGPPSGGPWHLIHARLVLLHLPARRRLLRQFADALAPGGWLVLGEFSRHPLTVLTARSDADAVLFNRVINALATVLTAHGADLDWAHAVHPALVDLGLTNVHTVEHAESWTGGGTGAHLHHVNTLQKHDELLATGLTEAELDRFRRVVADPGFAARSWQFVCTRGQRPEDAGT